MSNGATILFKDIKNFLSNEVNRIFIAVVILGLFTIYNYVRIEVLFYSLNRCIEQNHKELIKSDEKIIRKVNFRYYNLTRSLEEINKVKINTKDGKLDK